MSLPGILNITAKELLDSFQNASFIENLDGAKMKLIYFLNCGLLGVATHTFIDLKWVKLVNNLGMFNQYQWGVIMYNEITKALYNAFLNLTQNRLKKNNL